MHHIDPTVLVAPALPMLIVAEMVFGWLTTRAAYEARDTITNLLMGAGSLLTSAPAGAIFAVVAVVLSPFRIADIEWSWGAVAAAIVVEDFLHYWHHRFDHRVRWLWANHSGHHSSQHFNLSVAIRQSWTPALTPGFLFRAPMVLLGFPVGMIVLAKGINLLYQFWLHTEVIRKMPSWFEAVFNTPSHHRVHHAINPRYLDANYAGTLIIWDRIFSTFVGERADDPPRYGLTKNIATFNVARVAFHEWADLVRDLAGATTAREWFGYVFCPPGWKPNGEGETTESIRARASLISDASPSVGSAAD